MGNNDTNQPWPTKPGYAAVQEICKRRTTKIQQQNTTFIW